MIKKPTPQEIELLQDPDEDFIPSESDDDDDDDDESYLPEHDRRPYNRNHHFNGTIGRGKIESFRCSKKKFFIWFSRSCSWWTYEFEFDD